jgi:hypothetical protein
MFEESPDGFVSRWRSYAASVRVFSRTEGLPMLEFEAAGAILQVLERTGPYLAPPGNARMIINPTAESLDVRPGGHKSLESIGLGRARAIGVLTLREDPFLVVDAGVPLVVSVSCDLPEDAVPGAWVSFEAVPPIHGFVLREPTARVLRSAEGEAA